MENLLARPQIPRHKRLLHLMEEKPAGPAEKYNPPLTKFLAKTKTRDRYRSEPACLLVG
jgi:hypothetical protein